MDVVVRSDTGLVTPEIERRALSPDTLYHGWREDGRLIVVAADPKNSPPYALPPRNDLWNHSPTGLECGYGGSGPAQLALALLAHATGSDELAVQRHQDFKWARIAGLPRDGWCFTAAEIREWAGLPLSYTAAAGITPFAGEPAIEVER